jgi:hypothetical protein
LELSLASARKQSSRTANSDSAAGQHLGQEQPAIEPGCSEAKLPPDIVKQFEVLLVRRSSSKQKLSKNTAFLP